MGAVAEFDIDPSDWEIEHNINFEVDCLDWRTLKWETVGWIGFSHIGDVERDVRRRLRSEQERLQLPTPEMEKAGWAVRVREIDGNNRVLEVKLWNR